jgi:predicted dehydrogenase
VVSSVPAPRSVTAAPALRRGLIGPGGIAARFVQAVHSHSRQRFVAVGSRSHQRAERFAAVHGIDRAYGSYEALVADRGVQVVYVASPHSAHLEHTLLALSHRKHVLVEKPMAASAAQAQAIAAASGLAGLLVMEAMWTRYLPQADVIRQLLDADAVGDVQMVSADFGFAAPFDPTHRLFDPAQAGGALLDAGVYPISFAVSVLGPAVSTAAQGTLAPTGVDATAAVLTDHGGPVSTALTSITASLPTRATIMGSRGRIDIDPPFFAPGGLTLTTGNLWGADADTARWQDPARSDPYAALHCEADALARYVSEGRTESAIHPLDETIAALRIIDAARSLISAI